MDVYVFNECLQNYNDDIPSGIYHLYNLHLNILSHSNSLYHIHYILALKSYEEQRLPEAKALCEIMSFGYPQQVYTFIIHSISMI
jgi:hypothetical protein